MPEVERDDPLYIGEPANLLDHSFATLCALNASLSDHAPITERTGGAP
jgi:hypothetical protein